MNTLTWKTIRLRALEPEDLQFLFDTENNESFWEVSHTQTPFSKFLLKQYLENAHLDIFEAKQLRLIIEEQNNNQPVGMIDLFDFNPQHRRAGIGILIHEEHQQKGFEIGRAHVWTPVTSRSRMPSSAWKKKESAYRRYDE